MDLEKNGETNGINGSNGTRVFGLLKDSEDELSKSSSSSSLGKDCNNNSPTFNMDKRLSVSSQQSLLPAKLGWRVKFFYSLGHIYNDLVVSIWFSYTLLFFKFQFAGPLAGALILLGQVADAIASPFVGFESDKSAHMWLCAKYGRRKTWHLLGTILNTLTVPLVYNQCFTCENSPQASRFFYYGVLIFIFQAGWAATQVSHVSLITDLTQDTNERIALNAYRQAATIAANICVYSVTLLVIGFNDSGTIQEKDLVIFTKVSYIVCVIGLVFSVLFHVFVHEPAYQPKPRRVRPSVFTVETKRYLSHTRGSQGIITLLANQKEEPTSGSRTSISYTTDPKEFERRLKAAKKSAKQWHHWFKSLSFWKITLMYTLARMFVNVTQVYTTLYLQDYLQLRKQNIAIIPFATYFSGLVFSFVAKPISARFGSRVTLVVGCIFGILSSVWVFFGRDASFKTFQIYGVSGCLGIAGTALLISSLALTSDLIGGNTATGAFVFAAMSFFDKSINGVVIAVLEKLKPEGLDGGPMDYYRQVMIYITLVPSVLIALLLITIHRTQYGRRSRSNSVVSFH